MSPKDKKMTLSMNTGSKHVQIQKDKENGDRWRSVAAGGVSRSICKHCRLHRCTGSDGNKRQGWRSFRRKLYETPELFKRKREKRKRVAWTF